MGTLLAVLILVGAGTALFVKLFSNKKPLVLTGKRQSGSESSSKSPKKESPEYPINYDESFGRFELEDVDGENLDGTERQKNIKKCVKLHEGPDGLALHFFAERDQYDLNRVVVIAEEEKERKGESYNKRIGRVGFLPPDIVQKIEDKSGYEYRILVTEPCFFAIPSNGKSKLVGMSLFVRSYWRIYSDTPSK